MRYLLGIVSCIALFGSVACGGAAEVGSPDGSNSVALKSGDKAKPKDGEGCPAPAICSPCGDQSCATPVFDKKCNILEWSCSAEKPGQGSALPPVAPPADAPPADSTPPNPGPDLPAGEEPSAEPTPGNNCPVPAICQFCEDGSCAQPLTDAECNIQWVCPK